MTTGTQVVRDTFGAPVPRSTSMPQSLHRKPGRSGSHPAGALNEPPIRGRVAPLQTYIAHTGPFTANPGVLAATRPGH